MKFLVHTLPVLLLACGAGAAEPRGGPSGVFRTAIPEEPYTLILGRPTADSVAVSVVAYRDLEGYLRYGTVGGGATSRTETVSFRAGAQQTVRLEGLARDTRYWYEFVQGPASSGVFQCSGPYGFSTQRAPGAPFVFTMTADSHLDENTNPDIYARTLRTILQDRPDFHIDLGDTFMTGKRRDRSEDALPQYAAQRHYFGLIGPSTPLFLVLGNHDGETGRDLDVATRMRTRLFPNPVPDGFYSGGTNGNYYAWQWGDALFMVLDPYRYSGRPARGGEAGGWAFTLGRAQYDWLRATLENSRARFKFVFIHHLVGGLDRQGRGGAEAVSFFEWGGCERDGSHTFSANRPGWPMPVHELLRRNGVTAVFHGHDHFHARQEVDGIVYQLVPQPGHAGPGSYARAREYGYVGGDMQPGSGYVRVEVSDAGPGIVYVRTE